MYIILPDVNETIIVLIVSIVGGAVIIPLIKRYFFGNEIPYSKKEEHTKNICDVYMLLTRVGITQGRWKIPRKYFRKFPIEYKSSTDQFRKELSENKQVEQIYEDQLKDHLAYLYYYRALEHLKKHRKYKHIYKHWENTKNLLDELNGKTSIEEKIEGVIKKKMHRYFPALQSSASRTEFSDHYSMDNIMQFMMDYFKEQDRLSEHVLDSLVCGESAEDKFVYSEWSPGNFHIIMRSDGEIDFKTYKKLVREMKEDGSLKDFYNEYADGCNNIIKELNDFKDELEKLVKDLNTGKLIEGKCDVGF